MRPSHILISVMLFIITNAVLEVDDESTSENSGSDNFGIASMDSFNKDLTLHPDYTFAPDNFVLNSVASDTIAPDEENVMSVNSLNPLQSDFSGGTGGSVAISDSSNCASNLGKRQDSDDTLGNYSFPKRPYFSGFITKSSLPKSVKPVFSTLFPTLECPSLSASVLPPLCSFKAYPEKL